MTVMAAYQIQDAPLATDGFGQARRSRVFRPVCLPVGSGGPQTLPVALYPAPDQEEAFDRRT